MIDRIGIAGCGDIGRRVARLYQKKGVHTSGLVQSSHSLEKCREMEIDSEIYNLDEALQEQPKLLKTKKIFYFIPPPPQGSTDTRLKSFLNQAKSLPDKIVLISTTGVYGNSHGKWIDESYILNPDAGRAKRRLDAEFHIKNWAETYDKDYVILRVPGIYAANRLPLARLEKKLPVVNASEAPWTNRIHADDLAQVCAIAMDKGISGEIYNVTDGSPSTMTDYFNRVADFADMERPPQISMEDALKTLSPGMVSYLKESRRIRNDKLINELGVTLKYPNLEVGLPLS